VATDSACAASVEVMTSDGGQVEPRPRLDTRLHLPYVDDPTGREHGGQELTVGPDECDGAWSVDVPLGDEA
jgi:hypothetical protein